MMNSLMPLKIIFFCLIASVSSQISTSSLQTDFLTIVTAIIENKQTLSDNPNHLSTFAYWQGSFSNTTVNSLPSNKSFIQNFFDLPGKDGLVSEYWSHTLLTDNSWSICLQIYNGNYTDKDGLILEIENNANTYPYEINETNATIRFPYSTLYVSDYPDQTYRTSCSYAELYIYIVDKTTHLPPQTFNTSDLHACTKQFQIIDKKCGFNLTTSFFDDRYYISSFDKFLLIIGSLVYILASYLSRYTPKPNKRKVSVGTLRLLMFFSYYMVCYMVMWLATIYVISGFLYIFIPFAIAILVDFIKHSRELSRSDGVCCGCVLFGPLPAFILVAIPGIGVYIGNLLTCLYLLPQVVMKYRERHERQKHLTWFEIGNWTCISLWVLYLDYYPNNVFLSSPKPVLVFLHFTAIFIQFCVLLYLEYGVPRQKNFKYTFVVGEPVDQEKLIEEQCAICLSAFEQVNSTDNKLYKTPCGHLFHSSCLKEWGGKKLECPCCRKKIPDFIYPID